MDIIEKRRVSSDLWMEYRTVRLIGYSKNKIDIFNGKEDGTYVMFIGVDQPEVLMIVFRDDEITLDDFANQLSHKRLQKYLDDLIAY